MKNKRGKKRKKLAGFQQLEHYRLCVYVSGGHSEREKGASEGKDAMKERRNKRPHG